jgi:hypothetical protein
MTPPAEVATGWADGCLAAGLAPARLGLLLLDATIVLTRAA